MPREMQRSVLPIPDQPSFGLVSYDARDPDTKFSPIEPLRPPERAPNVVVITFMREPVLDASQRFRCGM